MAYINATDYARTGPDVIVIIHLEAMVNGRVIYIICRKLFCTICHLCIKNLHYLRRQAWTHLNNHLRGPYPYNSYPIFAHQPIGIWTSVNNYIPYATYPVCRVQHITKTAVTAVIITSYQVFKCWSTHTTINIFHSKPHTNRSDLTPQFHLLDPTMVYKHRDCYVRWLRGTYEYTRRHLVTDDRSNRRHLANVLVDMWSLKSGKEYTRGQQDKGR